MDPNMVRQQEQAEFEAWKSILRTLPEEESTSASGFEFGARETLAAAMGLSPGGISALLATGAYPKTWSSIFALLGRFISFPLAAQALGDGFAFVAAQCVRLQTLFARLAMSGTAGLFSAMWGFGFPGAGVLMPSFSQF